MERMEGERLTKRVDGVEGRRRRGRRDGGVEKGGGDGSETGSVTGGKIKKNL